MQNKRNFFACHWKLENNYLISGVLYLNQKLCSNGKATLSQDKTPKTLPPNKKPRTFYFS